MKYLAILFLAVSCNADVVSLAWNEAPWPTPLRFNVYGTRDLRAPLGGWAVLTNVPTTNATLVLPPGPWFFTVTAVDTNGQESGYATK